MSDDVASDQTLDAYISASAAFQGLTIESEWRPSVHGHLKTIAAAARLVLDFQLDDEVEAAPIFQP